LKSGDFRTVYKLGMRVSSPYFTAFCLERETRSGARLGFTVTRALGGAVVRNRARRRVREAARTRIELLGPQWDIVFNLRAPVLTAPFDGLGREIERVFSRCKP
jgi:ribonuclease P protein component